MDASEYYLVKEYKFDNPLRNGMTSVLDNFFGDCDKNYFQKFEDECKNVFKFKKLEIFEWLFLQSVVKTWICTI